MHIFVKNHKHKIGFPFNYIKNIAITVLFFLIICTPMVFKDIKIVCLVILILGFFLETIRSGSIKIHPKVFCWVIIFIVTNSFFLLHGTYDKSDVFLQLAPVYILWPIIYTLIISICSRGQTTGGITNFFVLSALVISFYAIYIVLNFKGLMPNSILLSLKLNQVINSDQGYIEFFIPNITSLFFLIPYVISIIIYYKQIDINIKKIYLWSVAISSIVACVLIGRRALTFIALLAPIMSLLVGRYVSIAPKNKLRRLLITFMMFMAMIGIYTYFAKDTSLDLRMFEFNTKQFFNSGMEREVQLFALIDGWKESPFIGAGYGINAEGSIRSDIPGAYELSYFAMLFQTGVIGMLIYFSLLVWIFKTLIKIIKVNKDSRGLIVPVLIGLSGILIANATNSYIFSFDGLWVLFYPLALINRYIFVLENKE